MFGKYAKHALLLTPSSSPPSISNIVASAQRRRRGRAIFYAYNTDYFKLVSIN
jgi:hypothetical protein